MQVNEINYNLCKGMKLVINYAKDHNASISKGRISKCDYLTFNRIFLKTLTAFKDD